MSKKKPYLVITRPEPGLSETADKVCLLGWRPLLMPVMKIQALPIQSIDMNGVQAIIFTSRQAITPTILQLSKQNIDYYTIPVFTVGDITAQDAKQAGFLKVISAGKDAVALADLLRKEILQDQGNVIFPSAKGQGLGLVNTLQQLGFSILHYELYKAEPEQKLTDHFIQELQAETINSILFFSSETARFFINLVPNNLIKYLKTIQAVGISSKTRKILKQTSWLSVDIATFPKTEEMLSLLKEHF